MVTCSSRFPSLSASGQGWDTSLQDQNTDTSKLMRLIQILIGFAKNAADWHQMNQVMGKPQCSVKNQNFVL